MFHLGLAILPIQTNQTCGSWRNTDYPVDRAFDRPELWVSAARICEEAKFDFVFCADTEGVFAEYRQTRTGALREGMFVPAFDQSVLTSFMAAGTTRIGTIATVSTTAIPPFLLARRMATMDHLSNGRTGWNIVTSTHKAGVQGVGLDALPPHDERYDRADEFVEVCKRLWNSWDEGAVVMDRARGMFVDPDKVHDVHFDGRWFHCHAPLNLHRSPQGGPLLVQAGASSRGLAFAGKHAELIFAIQPNAQAMRSYYHNAKEHVAKAGRDPEKCRVMFGMHAFIGDSEDEAREKRARHHALMTPERAMIAMSGLLGFDLSTIDPHAPLTGVVFPGAQSHVDNWARAGLKSMYEVALAHTVGEGPEAVGTPQRVADWLCDTMATAGGDGFMFSPRYLPHDLKEFTSKVVPILQSRGMVRTDYAGKTLRENVLAF